MFFVRKFYNVFQRQLDFVTTATGFWRQMHGGAWRADPAKLQLEFEDFQLRTSDGYTLQAWFVAGADVPWAKGDKRLGIVLHHHYGGQRANMLPWIRLFHRLGVDTIAFDARGHAASSPIAGWRDCFVRRAGDLHAACDELKRRGHTKIVVLGQSQGAAATAVCAAERDDVVAAIFDCGPAPMMSVASWGLAGVILARTPWANRPLPRAVVATIALSRAAPLRYLARLWPSLSRLRDKPLLWIHGDADDVVPRRWSELWYSHLDPGSGLWVSHEVPGGTHVRSIHQGGAELERVVARFIHGCRNPSKGT